MCLFVIVIRYIDDVRMLDQFFFYSLVFLSIIIFYYMVMTIKQPPPEKKISENPSNKLSEEKKM